MPAFASLFYSLGVEIGWIVRMLTTNKRHTLGFVSVVVTTLIIAWSGFMDQQYPQAEVHQVADETSFSLAGVTGFHVVLNDPLARFKMDPDGYEPFNRSGDGIFRSQEQSELPVNWESVVVTGEGSWQVTQPYAFWQQAPTTTVEMWGRDSGFTLTVYKDRAEYWTLLCAGYFLILLPSVGGYLLTDQKLRRSWHLPY